MQGEITKAIQETLVDPVKSIPNAFRKKIESQAPEQEANTARIDQLETEVRALMRSGRYVVDEDSAESNVLHRVEGLELPIREGVNQIAETLEDVEDWAYSRLSNGESVNDLTGELMIWNHLNDAERRGWRSVIRGQIKTLMRETTRKDRV
ncbi:MAG: hypothetical protein GY948_08220 [Alphaproteobacteria bacterium]|nr:hypothetical protein [Alphaproteobacteria bacterium]